MGSTLDSEKYGSDLIVRVLADEGIRHVALNPGATIRGLQESLGHFASRGGPNPLLCCHEEIAVGVAHGYAKASGSPMAVALHDVVGLQHATMAIFNAWSDRVPIVLLGGTGPMRQAKRRPWIDWVHTSSAQGGLVRDFVKWEIQAFGVESIESTVRRAVQAASSAPTGPVYACFDVEDQEAVLEHERNRPLSAGRVGEHRGLGCDAADIERVGDLLAAAAFPVIIADAYNKGGGVEAVRNLGKLSSRWAIPVVDIGARLNMATGHEFCLSESREELLNRADLVLALDVRDLGGALRARGSGLGDGPMLAVKDDTRIVSISEEPAPVSSWVSDYCEPVDLDYQIHGNSSRLVASLVDEGPAEVWKLEERVEVLRAIQSRYQEAWQVSLQEGWDATPISTARLCSELGAVMEQENWILANCTFMPWPQRLWDFDGDRLLHIGGSGGGGMGYGLSASVGAALAAKESGRIAVDIQGDGEALYVPSALWTAAKYSLPLLVVVHNNRSYFQDVLHQRQIADRRGRDGALCGVELTDPDVDFGAVARGFGVWAEECVTRPDSVRAALSRALNHIKEQESPALVDVLAAPR